MGVMMPLPPPDGPGPSPPPPPPLPFLRARSVLFWSSRVIECEPPAAATRVCCRCGVPVTPAPNKAGEGHVICDACALQLTLEMAVAKADLKPVRRMETK